MTYKEPEKPHRPFKKGDRVMLMDGDHTALSVRRIVKATKKVVTIEDGRRYRADDGWWIGENGVWPFPWIKLLSQ